MIVSQKMLFLQGIYAIIIIIIVSQYRMILAEEHHIKETRKRVPETASARRDLEASPLYILEKNNATASQTWIDIG